MTETARKLSEEQKQELPRERLETYGAGVLSAAELVAIILNTGMKGENVIQLSQRILQEHGGLSGLMRMEHADLAEIKGLGKAKAAKLKAALEMGRRLASMPDDQKPRMTTPEDIVRLLGVEMAYLEREELRVILLDTKHHILSTVTVAHGTVNSANVRMAEVLAPAVKRNAPYIALVHNHPTGDPAPSAADIRFTQDVIRAAEHLDIQLIDHIVIGQGRHASMRRLGLGFTASETP